VTKPKSDKTPSPKGWVRENSRRRDPTPEISEGGKGKKEREQKGKKKGKWWVGRKKLTTEGWRLGGSGSRATRCCEKGESEDGGQNEKTERAKRRGKGA
jgi:hypothetical protein